MSRGFTHPDEATNRWMDEVDQRMRGIENNLRVTNKARLDAAETLLNTHATRHTDGSDDIQDASASQKGLMAITAQSFAGVKTFTSFPVTPSSAPTTNYQVANKAYVDGLTGGDIPHWRLWGGM